MCIFREEARAKANEQSTIRSSMPKEIRAMLRSKDWMISPKSSSTSECTRSQWAVVEVDGHGGIAGEQAVGIAAIKDVLPRHGLGNLPQQHKFPHRAALGEGIVERAPLPVHNEHPGHIEVAQYRNHLGGVFRAEGVHAGEGGGHQLRLVLQRRLLGAVEELRVSAEA